MSHGEREDGVTAVAIPIFSARKDADYALAVAAPASRLKAEAIIGVILRTSEAVRAIAGQLYN